MPAAFRLSQMGWGTDGVPNPGSVGGPRRWRARRYRAPKATSADGVVRDGHVVHLEPEGLETNSIYVNGVSTSLPAEVQEGILRAIPGLEKAHFLRYGYAVEYDFFPPHQIDVTFETRRVAGLYMAGQICSARS